jgi:hypothetical protein
MRISVSEIPGAILADIERLDIPQPSILCGNPSLDTA